MAFASWTQFAERKFTRAMSGGYWRGERGCDIGGWVLRSRLVSTCGENCIMRVAKVEERVLHFWWGKKARQIFCGNFRRGWSRGKGGTLCVQADQLCGDTVRESLSHVAFSLFFQGKFMWGWRAVYFKQRSMLVVWGGRKDSRYSSRFEVSELHFHMDFLCGNKGGGLGRGAYSGCVLSGASLFCAPCISLPFSSFTSEAFTKSVLVLLRCWGCCDRFCAVVTSMLFFKPFVRREPASWLGLNWCCAVFFLAVSDGLEFKDCGEVESQEKRVKNEESGQSWPFPFLPRILFLFFFCERL